jgi:hypothetical protein
MTIRIEKSPFYVDAFHLYIPLNKSKENSSIVLSLEKNLAFYVHSVNDTLNSSVIRIIKEGIYITDKRSKKPVEISK